MNPVRSNEWGGQQYVSFTPTSLMYSVGLWIRYEQARRKDSRAKGADRSKRAPTTLGQQMFPRNGGRPRHFFGIIMGYASHIHINDCLFQSNIACF